MPDIKVTGFNLSDLFTSMLWSLAIYVTFDMADLYSKQYHLHDLPPFFIRLGIFFIVCLTIIRGFMNNRLLLKYFGDTFTDCVKHQKKTNTSPYLWGILDLALYPFIIGYIFLAASQRTTIGLQIILAIIGIYGAFYLMIQSKFLGRITKDTKLESDPTYIELMKLYDFWLRFDILIAGASTVILMIDLFIIKIRTVQFLIFIGFLLFLNLLDFIKNRDFYFHSWYLDKINKRKSDKPKHSNN